MKVVAFVLIALVMASVLCSASPPRRALVAVAAENGKNEKTSGGHPDGTISNHHNIPRQNYNQWGSSSTTPSGGDDGDTNNGLINGTG